MNPLALVLGGVAISKHAGAIRQNYEPIGGSTLARLSGGTGVKLTHWRKWRTTAAGTGELDPGLDLLDYSQHLELLCVKPRGIESASTSIELPPGIAWRTDEAPWALAQLGDQWIETTLVIGEGNAQLAAVTGAVRYRFCYLPRLLVSTEGPVSEFDQASGRYNWSLVAEQV
ncbi:hypothetical protein CDR19_25080 [Ectopseudomonas toyotomiensis]|uniref:Uncharacterized protein n=1 Tax=Ectopseudomonas toyotomiensis TaxID=554344 RepID=A0A1I5WZE8_9GAMM|nr:hypothetical protein [Pseudomonas toyotomiensis]PIA66363.1 hypothetical protein CDR19_25080 [Pseudomonas toyotomiensis]SFQ24966.1 hypothetical protein SAMN05216177_109252 [Pseudomonas toyotomiensis]SFQ45835.1 hypothetical protein SAMN05216177_11524 [Pseudomonas toyotomiensis]